MTDTTTEARVTTVTAEVRVLMVGSRQVTLSVAKQLDQVALSAIEPFGRVRIGDAEQVIGRSREDGTLVTARFNPLRSSRVPIYDDDLDPGVPAKPVVCDRLRGAAFGLSFRGRQIVLYAEADRCGKHLYGDECGSWDPNGHGEYIQAAIGVWDAAIALDRQAAALPLIVLAGLR